MKKLFAALFAISMLNASAELPSVIIDGLEYFLVNDEYAAVCTPSKTIIENDVIIENKVTIDGIVYPVTQVWNLDISSEWINVSLPESITKISGRMFHADIQYIPENLTDISSDGLSVTRLPEKLCLSSIENIGPNTFVGTERIKKIIIGAKLNALGEGAFIDSEVEVIEFEDRADSELNYVSFIADGAFYYASNLKELKFPKWVDVEYGDCAVLSCENLERVIFPDVPTIKYGYHKRYTDVMLEDRYVPIYGYLFRDCPKLKEIVCMGETPARITNIENFKEKCNSILYEEIYSAEEFTFMDNMDGCVLKVPAGSEELYRADPVWGRFQTILGFENGDYNLVSINSVETDENLEPVYYNLQGIQVKEPVKGQLYIRKAGVETTKVIM